jgi:deoxyadenosine/deoxycytidine kinase
VQLKYYDAYYKQWIADYDPIVNIDGNEIDLTCTPEKDYKNLEDITSIKIGSAVFAELTY